MLSEKKDIVEVISQYVELRKRGRECYGLCPLHADRRPSLRVSEEKQLWYCDPCGTGGDVIRFVELVEQCDFKAAIKKLKIRGEYKPNRAALARRAQAKEIVRWCRDTSTKICDCLRGIGDRKRIARMCALDDEVEILQRKAVILRTVDDDLNNPSFALEIYEQRAEIDALIASFA